VKEASYLYQTILNDASFYRQLSRFDEDLAEQARRKGCRCGGKLHRALYRRKVRGVPEEVEEEYGQRWSFCCAEEGCRKRTTPASLRFLSRRVYAAAVVVLVSALRHGVTAERVGRLGGIVAEISRRTLERWRQWWLKEFPRTSFWRAARGRFALPVDNGTLPSSLLEAFTTLAPEQRVLALLRFLLPLTTTSLVHES
jgi:hypothetical protein